MHYHAGHPVAESPEAAKEQRPQLYTEGLAIAERALAVDENNFAVHKVWRRNPDPFCVAGEPAPEVGQPTWCRSARPVRVARVAVVRDPAERHG